MRYYFFICVLVLFFANLKGQNVSSGVEKPDRSRIDTLDGRIVSIDFVKKYSKPQLILADSIHGSKDNLYMLINNICYFSNLFRLGNEEERTFKITPCLTYAGKRIDFDTLNELPVDSIAYIKIALEGHFVCVDIYKKSLPNEK